MLHRLDLSFNVPSELRGAITFSTYSQVHHAQAGDQTRIVPVGGGDFDHKTTLPLPRTERRTHY